MRSTRRSARRSVVTSSATVAPVSSTPQARHRSGLGGNTARHIGHLEESKKGGTRPSLLLARRLRVDGILGFVPLLMPCHALPQILTQLRRYFGRVTTLQHKVVKCAT